MKAGLRARAWRSLPRKGALFGGFSWGALVLSLAAAVFCGERLLEIRHANVLISALAAGQEAAVGPSTAPEALLARLRFLLDRGRFEEAQALADASLRHTAPALQARALGSLANARVRAAIEHIEKGAFDRAIPLINLAKAEYRLALRLAPDDWDLRYNFDVAQRFVRDFPGAGDAEEETPQTVPKRVWTDLPGLPRGLP